MSFCIFSVKGERLLLPVTMLASWLTRRRLALTVTSFPPGKVGQNSSFLSTTVNVVVLLLSKAASMWPFPAKKFGEYFSHFCSLSSLLLRLKSMHDNHLPMAIALLCCNFPNFTSEKIKRKKIQCNIHSMQYGKPVFLLSDSSNVITIR